MFRSKLSAAALVASLAVAGSPLAAHADLPDFRALVRTNQAAVVNISTTQTVKTQQWQQFPGFPQGAIPEGSPFEEFFKHFGDGRGGEPRERQAQSLGSGFIMSADGLILTNAHVVDGADSILVRMSDHSEKPAKIVGIDKASDVALLKIDAKGLPVVKLGDSSKLAVGDWVLAIGSPFGLESTATQGIVSAVGRTLPDDSYVPFIQTDVAINPGNSGGPLFNTAGEVIGINSQIYSRTGGYMGLSFAIPINVATNVARQLQAQGFVARGWLGIGIQGMSGELARSFGLDRPHGALVGQVDPRGPASRAGIQTGDIILAYDGQKIEESSDLPHLVGETTPGKSVTLTIWRDKREQRVPLMVAALEKDKSEQQQRVAADARAPSRLNIQVSPLTEEQRNEARIEKGGVLVVDVGDGPAARAGMEEGDILLALNNQAVSSPEQLATLVKSLPRGAPVPVLVQRNEQRIFLPLTINS